MSNVLNPQGSVESFSSMLKPIPANLPKGRAATSREAREASRIEGYDAGYQAGLAQATRDVQTQHEAMTKSLADHIAAVQDVLYRLDNEFAEALDAWSEQMAIPVAEVALAVATRIVGKQITLDPDTSVEIAKQALREVTHAIQARLKVNPADAAALREAMPELLGASSSIRNIEIIGDPTITAGCRVESDGGIVDATIETMIQQAQRAMRMEDAA